MAAICSSFRITLFEIVRFDESPVEAGRSDALGRLRYEAHHQSSTMSVVAVQAENLSKRYRIPNPKAASWRRDRGRGTTPDGSSRLIVVDALRDVSFDVHQGEVFGIIGRNGAGKSTLLKILSRITTPSNGRAAMRGRVASLLEVGTGFHPDLTGRENVFLNGMLLGMPRHEVERVFDEIVDFAGVETYIDTPIKRYSSGMQLRLAFAVAAHLAADIIIVDEVLAVGDSEFQAKCTRSMRDAATRGRTTLFVSHNMVAIENLCTRALLLEHGEVSLIGPASDVTRSYLGQVSGATASRLGEYVRPAHIWRPVRIARVSMSGDGPGVAAQGGQIELLVGLDVAQQVRGLQLFIWLRTLEGQPVCAFSNGDARQEWDLSPGRYEARIQLKDAKLISRLYSVTVQLMRGWGSEMYDEVSDAVSFEITPRDVLGTGVSLLPNRGVTWITAEFSVQPAARQTLPYQAKT